MASICTDRIELNNGMSIPAFGYGGMETGMKFNAEDRPKIVSTIVGAIKAGYRLIDTANIYGTEEIVGEAIRTCGLPRSEITLVTKLWQSNHGRVKEAFQESLDRLDTEYVDIFLMHWPNAFSEDGKVNLRIDQSPTFLETWKDMEKLVGPKCRSIGVSNFSEKTLEPLLKDCKIKPVVNEIECHPLNPHLKLVPWCQDRQIQILAWAPLAGGPKSLYTEKGRTIYGDPQMISIAEKHQVTVGQVILSYLVQRRIIPIPHSGRPERLVENITLVKLNDEEMRIVDECQDRIGKVRLIEHISVWWQDDGVVRNEDGSSKGRTLMGWTKQELGWEDSDGHWLT